MDEMSPAELDALAAIVDLSQARDHFKPTELINHRLLKQISRASKYRVVHSLEERGVLKPVDLKGRRYYTLNSAGLGPCVEYWRQGAPDRRCRLR